MQNAAWSASKMCKGTFRISSVCVMLSYARALDLDIGGVSVRPSVRHTLVAS